MSKSVIYILRRFFFYGLAGFMAITLNFLIPRLMPGDPASIMFAQFKGKLKPESLEALKETFGFTEGPLLQQYFDYLAHLFQGDLGLSISYFPQPVTEVISSGLYWTIFLAGTSLLISFVIGSLIGVYLAWNRDRALDSFLIPTLSFLGAFPYFWIAMLLLYYFGFVLDWFPLRHAYSQHVAPGLNIGFIFSVINHSILPAFTLIFVSLGGWMLSMRNNMISTLGTEYVNYAKAIGYSKKLLMMKFAARNALLPSITGFGMAIGFVLSGALLTEIIFSYPGQGYLLLQAVRAQDFPLLQGIFLTITLSVLISNLVVDIVLLFLDPRIRK